jgi:hypothetical protein
VWRALKSKILARAHQGCLGTIEVCFRVGLVVE